MSELDKAESARINGAKSKGPITPEGKAICSLNALKYGFSAKTMILQNENPADFAELLESYIVDLAPSNQPQRDLVADIVAARWRLRRIWNYENAMLDVEMDLNSVEFAKRFVQVDESVRGGMAYQTLADKGQGMSTALRYHTHLTRTYRQTLEYYKKIAKQTQL